MTLRVASLFMAGLLLASCGGRQSALDAAGQQAERLQGLWWSFFYVTAVVYVIVMCVLLAAMVGARKSSEPAPADVRPDEGRERRVTRVVQAAVGVTLIAMFILMVTSFRAGRAINNLQSSPNPLVIKVTGSQFWWNFEYQDPTPSNNIQTANLLHLPVGRPVKLELNSTDVIHSFWLPNMHGKKDLIPNYPTTFMFQPDRIGEFDGQCAEFCGYQHAKMRFKVIVESPEDFAKWVAAQSTPPPPPTGQTEIYGQHVFLTSTCTQCHTIQGTPAGGKVGPNLTHVGSRPYIAAGSLPNTDENLRRWITDSQSIKPGNRMPMNTFSDEDLNAIVAYLRSLK